VLAGWLPACRVKDIQRSQYWPMNMKMAAMASEGQQGLSPQEQWRAGSGLNVKHKAGIALLQHTGQGAEVLLVQQANGRWSLPKGKRKKGESIKQTGLRECREETGYQALALQFVGWGVNSRKHVRFYLWKSEAHHLCSESDLHPRLRKREILGLAWVALAQAQKMLKPWQASLLLKVIPSATNKPA
jgi:8-oxo-dGTP pyrophosphatase MutT (NUDIX family)